MDKRAVRFPAGFQLDIGSELYAIRFGLSPSDTFEHFKDHHLAKGSRFVDWRAAFRTWCRRAQVYGTSQRVPFQQHSFDCMCPECLRRNAHPNLEPRYCATCGHTGSWHKNELHHGRNPGHKFVLAIDISNSSLAEHAI